MKYTKKNYPTYRSYKGIVAAPLTYEEWGKGFWKELREIYEDDVNYISKKDVIKEILGE